MKKLNVHIYVTPVCNIHCKHCYYDARQEIDEVQMLTLDQFRSIFTELDQNYDADFHVEGGELFLRKNIPELFEALPESILKNITITTNGTIDLNAHKSYLRKVGCLRISVCGHTDEMQMELRGIKLVPVMKNIQTAVREQVPLTLRMTLHRQNYAKLLEESIIYYHKNENVKRFSLFEFQSVGRGQQFDELFTMTEKDCENVLQLLERIDFGDANLMVSFSERRKGIVKQYEKRLEQQGYEVRYLPTEQCLTVNYDGTVGICAWSVGNDMIGKYTTDMETIIRDINLYHTCEHCSAITIQNRK